MLAKNCVTTLRNQLIEKKNRDKISHNRIKVALQNFVKETLVNATRIF